MKNDFLSLSLSHWAQKGAETFLFHCLPVLDPGQLGLRHNPAEAGVEARSLLPTVAANVLRRGMLKFCISLRISRLQSLFFCF